MEFEIRSPFDGKLLKTLQLESYDEVEKKLSLLYDFFEFGVGKIDKAERIRVLEKLRELIKKEYRVLVDLAISEGGKPKKDTIVEMDRAVDGISIAIETLRGDGIFNGRQIPMNLNNASKNRFAFTEREPIGVVFAVSAFNHPINLIIHQVIPAFAVGSPVLIKPALKTPLTCLKLVEIFREAGINENYLQVAICSDRVSSEIIKSDKISYFSFIGSAAVGWELIKTLSPGTHYGLEHGGTASTLILEDCKTWSESPLDLMVKKITKGAFYHSGQVCVSTQKVFIPTEMTTIVIQKLKEEVQRLKLDDPADKDTDLGPIINKEALNKIELMVNAALGEENRNANCKLIMGGKKYKDVFFEPTVLLNPSLSSVVSSQEVFGPVLCLYEYESVEQAISQMNDTKFVFQASIFTQNIEAAFKLSSAIKAKAIMINDHTAFRTDWMPFGGSRASGIGVGGINYSMLEFSSEKLKVFNLNY